MNYAPNNKIEGKILPCKSRTFLSQTRDYVRILIPGGGGGVIPPPPPSSKSHIRLRGSMEEQRDVVINGWNLAFYQILHKNLFVTNIQGCQIYLQICRVARLIYKYAGLPDLFLDMQGIPKSSTNTEGVPISSQICRVYHISLQICRVVFRSELKRQFYKNRKVLCLNQS